MPARSIPLCRTVMLGFCMDMQSYIYYNGIGMTDSYPLWSYPHGSGMTSVPAGPSLSSHESGDCSSVSRAGRGGAVPQAGDSLQSQQTDQGLRGEGETGLAEPA